ncbi:hypothetical protein HYU94_01445 [Candidatus Daviesbacteria bacterium]|nr:hypothetical protein [Candidatus Daviesbacteria bacterium]
MALENILERAARVSEEAKNRKALLEKDGNVSETRRVFSQAKALCSMLTIGVKARIMQEAEAGNDSLVVMGMTTDRTKKEVRALDDYYDSEDPVNRAAFDLVFQKCTKMGLHPYRELDGSYYGEPIDPIRTVIVKWGSKG